MSGRSRSSLFLIEQLIVITIFAVCASACVKIFVGSYLMANDTRDRNQALVAAKGAAECYKAYGDLEKTAAALTGRGYNGTDAAARVACVYYDKEWRFCGEKEAAYVLRLRESEGRESERYPALCEISVEKITGEELIAFTVAGRVHAKRVHAGRMGREEE